MASAAALGATIFAEFACLGVAAEIERPVISKLSHFH